MSSSAERPSTSPSGTAAPSPMTRRRAPSAGGERAQEGGGSGRAAPAARAPVAPAVRDGSTVADDAAQVSFGGEHAAHRERSLGQTNTVTAARSPSEPAPPASPAAPPAPRR